MIVLFNIVSGIIAKKGWANKFGHVLFKISILGMIGNIAVPIVQGISSDSTAHVLEVFISLFFPTYALSNGLIKIYNNEYGRIACEKVICSSDAQIAKSCCGTSSGRFFPFQTSSINLFQKEPISITYSHHSDKKVLCMLYYFWRSKVFYIGL